MFVCSSLTLGGMESNLTSKQLSIFFKWVGKFNHQLEVPQIAPNFAKDIEVIEDKIVCMHGGLSPELGAPGHGTPGFSKKLQVFSMKHFL